MVKIGQKAPHFNCEAALDGKVKNISLDDCKGSYTVLFFYPFDFTYVCPTEIHAFEAQIHEFREKGAQVIGVSIDSVHSHLAWLKIPKVNGGIEGITYPLISDIHKTMIHDYGVYKEDEGTAFRGLFLLDKHNVVQHASINNLPLGRNVAEVLRLIDALKHHETNGEVCPANWTQGSKALTPDQAGLKSYFG